MADRLERISDDFFNIRGSFKVAVVVDIGTQASLVRRDDGSFVMLDSYTLKGEVLDEVMALTDDGRAVQAILHLHPFHTIHVKKSAAQFPDARQYGTDRHVRKAPDLRWEPERTDHPDCHALFADDLAFSVPRGVDFVPDNEHLHFASVLAFHPASRTLHVDDTLMFNKLPVVGGLSLHPTLGKVLQRRPGAVAEFRAWGDELVAQCADVEQVCPAHVHLPPRQPPGQVAQQVRQAFDAVEKTLAKHEAAHG
jgi:hypothetical protein